MRSYWYVVLLSSALTNIVSAEDWLYAADLSSGTIHGVPTTDLGTRRMVPISGKITVSAEQAVHLNDDEVVFIPLATNKLVHLHLPTGQLSPVGELQLQVRHLSPLSDGSGFSVIEWPPVGTNQAAAHRFVRQPGGGWTQTSVAMPTTADSHVFAGDSWFVLRSMTYWNGSALASESTISRLQPDGTLTALATVPFPYTTIENTPQGFVVMGAGLSPLHFDPQGEILNPPAIAPEITNDSLATINFGPEPSVHAVLADSPLAGSVAIQPAEPDTLELVSPPFTSGDQTATLVGAANLRPIGEQNYAYHDRIHGGIHRVNASTRRVSQYFLMSRGSGPVFEDIKALATGPDGLLYVLDIVSDTHRIIRVNPSTGNRTILWTQPDLRLRSALSVAAPDRFYLVEEALVALQPSFPAFIQQGDVRRLEVRLESSGPVLSRTEYFRQTLPSYSNHVTSEGTVYTTSNNPSSPGIHRINADGTSSLHPAVPLNRISESSTFQGFEVVFELPENPQNYGGVYMLLDLAGATEQPSATQAFYTNYTFTRAGSQAVEAIQFDRFEGPAGTAYRAGLHLRQLEGSDLSILQESLPPSLQSRISLYATQLGDAQFLVPFGATSARLPLAVRHVGRGFYRLSNDMSGVESTIPIVPEGFEASELIRQAGAFIIEADNALYLVGPEGWELYRVDLDTGSAINVGALLSDTVNLELSGNSTNPPLFTTLAPAPAIIPTGWQVE